MICFYFLDLFMQVSTGCFGVFVHTACLNGDFIWIVWSKFTKCCERCQNILRGLCDLWFSSPNFHGQEIWIFKFFILISFFRICEVLEFLFEIWFNWWHFLKFILICRTTMTSVSIYHLPQDFCLTIFVFLFDIFWQVL